MHDSSRPQFLSCAAIAFLFFASLAPALAEDRSQTIPLRTTTIDIRAPKLVADELKVDTAEEGADELHLIKFPRPITTDQKAALESRVERIYTYLPHDAYLVRLAPEKRAGLGDALGLAWSGPYHPAYKIAPSIERTARWLEEKGAMAEKRAMAEQGRPEKGRAGERATMLLHVLPDADLGALEAKITRLGAGTVVARAAGERFGRLRLRVPGPRLVSLAERLAKDADIFFIDVEPRRALLNDSTTWVGQSGLDGGETTPIWDRGLLGQGQIVGVLDTGIDPDMCFFRDEDLGLPPINACDGGTETDPAQRKVIAVDFLWDDECADGIDANEWDTQDHGTHVAGTLAGDDFANPVAQDPGDGMAPGAKLVVQDCGYGVDECADCPGLGCPVVDLGPIFQQAFDQGAHIHSNSWGDDEENPVQGLYSAGSEDADTFMWHNPEALLVFAAGNTGSDSGTVLSPATAKSVVAVGATLRGADADSMAFFSSCGPTQDGRIKPDVTMPGVSIISANSDNNASSNNCNVRGLSGTSMATPAVSGSLALIRQYFTDGFYPSGAAVVADAFTPTGALLKATLIHSATDMTEAPAPIPSDCQGWGRVLLEDALHFSGENRKLFVADDRSGFAGGSTGEIEEFNFSVTSSSEPLKVTLTWTDYPSTPAAASHLVNDLDLEVTGPSGTYLGNAFAGGVSVNGTSANGVSADRLNTVEQVLIAAPTPGLYSVRVRSFTVVNGPQPFALVASADFAANAAPTVSIVTPEDGSSFSEYAVIDLVGEASDSEDGEISASIEWSSSLSGSLGTGSLITPTLAPGNHTITATVTDSRGATSTDTILLNIEADACLLVTDFDAGAVGWSGGGTCTTGHFLVDIPQPTNWQPGGGSSGPGPAYFTARNYQGDGFDDVDGGTCEAYSPLISTVGLDAVEISFDYFHGQRYAGNDPEDGFTVEVWNDDILVATPVDIGDVTHHPAWTSASAVIENPGDLRLVLRASDGPAAGDFVEAGIDNLRICPTTPSCTVVDDLEDGAAGWTVGSGSTCATGWYVYGDPTLQSSGGVTTQVGGSYDGVSSIFTAANTAAGLDDVDGGVCILNSPTWAVAEPSTLSVFYFHGQRSMSGDTDDFFALEYSLDAGASWQLLAFHGDAPSHAAWQEVRAPVAAGSDVTLRMHCSDGPTSGDFVECGIDHISFCTEP